MLACDGSDVDLDGGRLRVEQSLEQTKAGLKFKSPKTKFSRRSITLPASLVAELRGHWTAQQQQRLALGLGKAADDDLVFSTWDGNARSPNALTKEWSVPNGRRRAQRHIARPSPYARVVCLIAAGVDISTIFRRLGHAPPLSRPASMGTCSRIGMTGPRGDGSDVRPA